jgi:hypothetical protein
MLDSSEGVCTPRGRESGSNSAVRATDGAFDCGAQQRKRQQQDAGRANSSSGTRSIEPIRSAIFGSIPDFSIASVRVI